MLDLRRCTSNQVNPTSMPRMVERSAATRWEKGKWLYSYVNLLETNGLGGGRRPRGQFQAGHIAFVVMLSSVVGPE